MNVLKKSIFQKYFSKHTYLSRSHYESTLTEKDKL